MSLSIDTANQIINDQEDVIADLRHKLLEMEDLRDLAVGKGLELVNALRRIECSVEAYEHGGNVLDIVKRAIDAYQAK